MLDSFLIKSLRHISSTGGPLSTAKLLFLLLPASMGLEFSPTTHCTCHKRRLSSLGPPPLTRRGCSNLSPPHGGVPWMQKLKASLVGAQSYQRFPFSKPVVGQNIALHAYRASIPN